MEINERFLKVGKLPVRVPMELGGSTVLKLSGEDESYVLTCTKVEHNDNQDGTEDVTYILKYQP